MNAVDEYQKYQKHYSDESFRQKLSRYALKVGRDLVEKSLQLWCVAKDPDVPLWAKGMALGALGYFISPFDAIPDAVPLLGYSDDALVVAAALIMLATYTTPTVKAAAHEKLEQWFE